MTGHFLVLSPVPVPFCVGVSIDAVDHLLGGLEIQVGVVYLIYMRKGWHYISGSLLYLANDRTTHTCSTKVKV